MWDKICQHISQATGEPFRLIRQSSLGGGCINAAHRLAGEGRDYFVKLNDAVLSDMFEAEAEGLAEMARTQTIRVPTPICWGTAAGQAYLVLEYIPLGGSGTDVMERFGRELAAMHRTTQSRYGWHRDNTIGSTAQINTQESDWLTFWREHRLRFQLELAARKGGGRLLRQGERLLEVLPAFFSGYQPQPSLLHGDLWSGNYAIAQSGEPVIFDPAVYYGDREADLAMTELFGGFGGHFYAAYNEAWPLDAGYATRKTLYNLYHIINHFNLFGGGYAGQAERMIERLLGEVRG